MPLKLIRSGHARTYELVGAPITIGDEVVTVQTPRLYGPVIFTATVNGAAQVGLFMPRVFTAQGQRYRERVSGWRTTGVNGGGVFFYGTDPSQTLVLPPGYYVEGVEVSRWGGGGEITNLRIQN